MRKPGPAHVKHRPERRHGRALRLFADEGCGIDGGAEVYFQRDSVARDDGDRPDTLSEVGFTLMQGEKGTFAVNLPVRGWGLGFGFPVAARGARLRVPTLALARRP